MRRNNALRPIIDLPVNRERWMTDGACANIEPQYDVFFPEEADERKNRQQERKAKAICSTCPVAWECLDFAFRGQEIHGIWGGMTLQERSDLSWKHRGHTSPGARAAHRRFITELNRKKNANVGRHRWLRPRG